MSENTVKRRIKQRAVCKRNNLLEYNSRLTRIKLIRTDEKADLQENSEVNDDDACGDHHVLRWDEVWHGDDQTVGDCTAQSAVSHDELVHLGEAYETETVQEK